MLYRLINNLFASLFSLDFILKLFQLKCNPEMKPASKGKTEKFNNVQQFKQLYRSSSDVILGGVCSGLGRYLNIDTTIIRIVFILITLFLGSGVLLYVLLWIFVPMEPVGYEFGDAYNKDFNKNFNDDNMDPQNQQNQQNPDEFMKNYQKQQKNKKDNANFVGGIILITVGLLFLISEYIPRIDFGDLWPIILIVIGALMLRNNYQNRNKNGDQAQ